MQNIKSEIMLKPAFDVEKIYPKYKKCLKGVKEGEIVTRFPPEASGFLHIGHVKAAIINYHYSKIFKGKMLLRWDDTNPSKEKEEFEQSIREDLEILGIIPDKVSYTSDHFETLLEYATNCLKDGLAYADKTPLEQMRKERSERKESEFRNNSVEENLRLWEEMQKGSEEGLKTCLRVKIDMKSNNGCMRDPVIYRTKIEPHIRFGDKYKAYPTYDFAIPIVDSIEGVTYAMRTNEYADRNHQYNWFLKNLKLRNVKIYDYSRVNFVSTTLSKRKLAWFVDNGLVDGWNDPRFPTVKGILRKGMQISALTEFMLEQGPSKATNLMEWDKIWANNRKHIDPIAPRFTAISKSNLCLVKINNINENIVEQVNMHPKNQVIGTKPLIKSHELLIEYEDAKDVEIDQVITFMKWGNFKVIKKDLEKKEFEVEYLPEDKDFKKTKKFTWLTANKENLVNVNLIEYDHLITKRKVEENDNMADIANKNSKFITESISESHLDVLKVGQVIQFERRGYFILDKKCFDKEGNNLLEFIYVPDGKEKNMSNLATKIDAVQTTKGNK